MIQQLCANLCVQAGQSIANQCGSVQFVVTRCVEGHDFAAKGVIKSHEGVLFNLKTELRPGRIQPNQYTIDPVQRSARHQTDIALDLAVWRQLLLNVAFTQLASRGQLRAGQSGRFVEPGTGSD